MTLPARINTLWKTFDRKQPTIRRERSQNAQLKFEVLESRQLLASIDLGMLTPAQGTAFIPDAFNGGVGTSVSSAGDFNGDGFEDMLIGDDAVSSVAGLAHGRTWLILGSNSLSPTITLGALVSGGIAITGIEQPDRSGHSVSGVGDVNGDGFDDILIGANTADGVGNMSESAGESYVIFGRSTVPQSISLASLGSGGVTIYGIDRHDQSGISVSGAGDINGDGFADLLIGAPYTDGSSNLKLFSGESYVVFGAASMPQTIHLSSLGSAGVTIFGANAGDQSGRSVSRAGDVNGDGIDDLIIGADFAAGKLNTPPGAGQSYLIYGSTTLPQTIDLSNLGNRGVVLYGSELSDHSGFAVSDAGDVNADGFDDLLINALNGSGPGNSVDQGGDTYLVFGGAALPQSISLDSLGTRGITISGSGVQDYAGSALGSAGDVNNDGFGDIVISAYRADGVGNLKADSGETYLIFGNAVLPNNISLGNLGPLGVTIYGAQTGDWAGFSVKGSGDVNGDGFDEILITAPLADIAIGSNYGQAYVIFGSNSMAHSATGTNGNDDFVLSYSSSGPSRTVTVTRSTNGGSATNLGTFTMDSLATINGLGGTDSVRIVGTSGADTITVTSSGLTIEEAGVVLNSIENRTLVGGAGNDIYKFDADVALGLFTLDESGGGTDTIDCSLTTTLAVNLHLGRATAQVVNANLSLTLGSATTFENSVGGSGADTLTGNTLSNRLTGNAGNDTLNGGKGNDTLVGGKNDDTYVFASASVAEADIVIEVANHGSDTLSFASLTTALTVNLGSAAVQNVHTNRTLMLNSGSTFENVIGGSAADVLLGNALNNRLTGGNGNNILVGNSGSDTLVSGTGRDILIGGLGLDTLNGGTGDDILIAGRTTSDANVTKLLAMQAEWTSANSYSTRIANLRAGVGSPPASLKATVNVQNDAGEDDLLTGGGGTDWYFKAIDDLITDLFVGEITDLL